MHWCPTNSPRLLFETRALGRFRLTATTGQERLTVQCIEFLKPLRWTLNDRLEQHSLRNPPDAHMVAREAKFPRQTHCLTAAILKQLGDFRLGHSPLLPLCLWYISRV